MLEIATGVVRAYYLFDVADTIDLAAMGADSARVSHLPNFRFGRIPRPPTCSFRCRRLRSVA